MTIWTALIWAQLVTAAPASPPVTPGSSTDASIPGVAEAAEGLFQQAVAAYDARDYRRAIDLFTAAHKASPIPEILFDIGQAYRALGDCRSAIAAYDAFAAAAPSDHPLLPRVNARRAELRSCAAPATPPLPPAAPCAARVGLPVALALAPPPTAAGRPSLPLSTAPALGRAPAPLVGKACLIGAGAATALTLAGIVLGGETLALGHTVERADTWDVATQQADQRRRAFSDATSAVFLAAGVSAAATALGCWLTRHPETGR